MQYSRAQDIASQASLGPSRELLHASLAAAATASLVRIHGGDFTYSGLVPSTTSMMAAAEHRLQ